MNLGGCGEGPWAAEAGGPLLTAARGAFRAGWGGGGGGDAGAVESGGRWWVGWVGGGRLGFAWGWVSRLWSSWGGMVGAVRNFCVGVSLPWASSSFRRFQTGYCLAL